MRDQSIRFIQLGRAEMKLPTLVWKIAASLLAYNSLANAQNTDPPYPTAAPAPAQAWAPVNGACTAGLANPADPNGQYVCLKIVEMINCRYCEQGRANIVVTDGSDRWRVEYSMWTDE